MEPKKIRLATVLFVTGILLAGLANAASKLIIKEYVANADMPAVMGNQTSHSDFSHKVPLPLLFRRRTVNRKISFAAENRNLLFRPSIDMDCREIASAQLYRQLGKGSILF